MLCPQPLTTPMDSKGFVLIGIMTAAQYVDTRAYNVWKTWAQHINGKVLFFVADGTESVHEEMPIVRLRGVNDTYPPQKKSFAMMRWMADNHLEDFEWFMRADDDLYIKGYALEKLLRSLDPMRPHAIGQAGLGNTAEYGLLSLGTTDNYCMGGPGVVVSRETLRRVSPHLQDCLSHLMTTHEDVELGRCIRKHVGVACTWNYEMQKLFHNNQTTNIDYTAPLEEVKTAITMHPIKEPQLMKRIHADVTVLRLREARKKRAELRMELEETPLTTLVRNVPRALSELPVYSFIDSNRIIFCVDGVNCPRHTLENTSKNEMNRIVTQLFDELNANARQRGRVLQFQNLQYAYSSTMPRHGVDYIVDMILWFKKFRPPHRTTISVRRHAYVRQTLAPLKSISDEGLRQVLYGKDDLGSRHIYIVLPLKGRSDIFQRFSTHLRNVCMRGHDISLVLVVYNSDDVAVNRETAERMGKWMGVRIVEMGDEPFSRGVALTAGSADLPDDALLFFTDVDMLFTCDCLDRIRLNTVYGSQVFFPIVFSEFSSASWSENDKLLADSFHYGRRRGYFRHFGYGLAAMYKKDLKAIGGFDTNITGWGMEDVDLFEKSVKTTRLRVLRAPEPGLVHIYHPIICNTTMPAAQLKMCHGSKAASLASIDALVEEIAHLTQ